MYGSGEPGSEKLKIKETLMQLTVIDQTPNGCAAGDQKSAVQTRHLHLLRPR
jgi:hypothetical protein